MLIYYNPAAHDRAIDAEHSTKHALPVYAHPHRSRDVRSRGLVVGGARGERDDFCLELVALV